MNHLELVSTLCAYIVVVLIRSKSNFIIIMNPLHFSSCFFFFSFSRDSFLEKSKLEFKPSNELSNT